MLFILLSLCFFDEADQNTVFSEAALAEGQEVWQQCRKALGSEHLEKVSHVTFHMQETGRSGNSWVNEYHVNLNEPQFTLTTHGRSYKRYTGFDGHLGWEIPMNPTTKKVKHPPGLFKSSGAEEIRRWYQLLVVLLKQNYPVALLNEEALEGENHRVLRLLHPENGTLLVDVWVAADDFHISQMRIWSRIRKDGTQRSFIRKTMNYQDFEGLQLPVNGVTKIPRKLLSLEFLDEAPDYSKPEDAYYNKPR